VRHVSWIPDDLLPAVAAHYARASMPAWSPPRPADVEAQPEEYERVTDPQRYRVVHARARAWVAALAGQPGIRVAPLGADELTGTRRTGPMDRGVRVTCDRPGTLPLLFCERDATTSDDGRAIVPILQICLARPDLELEIQPDCGCDACDFGSANLLDAVDDAVTEVLRGPFALLRGPGWYATWHPEGGGAGGTGGTDLTDLRDRCRRLATGDTSAVPPGGEGFVSAPWFAARPPS
jgi:hypothetical protein